MHSRASCNGRPRLCVNEHSQLCVRFQLRTRAAEVRLLLVGVEMTPWTPLPFAIHDRVRQSRLTYHLQPRRAAKGCWCRNGLSGCPQALSCQWAAVLTPDVALWGQVRVPRLSLGQLVSSRSRSGLHSFAMLTNSSGTAPSSASKIRRSPTAATRTRCALAYFRTSPARFISPPDSCQGCLSVQVGNLGHSEHCQSRVQTAIQPRLPRHGLRAGNLGVGILRQPAASIATHWKNQASRRAHQGHAWPDPACVY